MTDHPEDYPSDRELMEMLLEGGYLHEGHGIYLRLGPDGMLESRAVEEEPWTQRPWILASMPMSLDMMKARREALERSPLKAKVGYHRIRIPDTPFVNPFDD